MLILLSLMTMTIITTTMFKFKWYTTTWSLLTVFFISSLIFFSPMNIPKTYQSLFTDYFSIPLIMLSSWISALMIISSNKILSTMKKIPYFLMMVTTLNMIIILMFSQKSLMMLYIFFEASLIPTLILILNWGYQPERLQAGMYMIIYTVMGALPFLINLLIIYKINGHSSLLLPMLPPLFLFSPLNNIWWTFMILAFLIKLPIYGTHLWLPKAHVEAPVAGSMILAGLLLKLGGYGVARMTMAFFKMNIFMNYSIISLSLIGGTVSSLICIRQNDMKSLVAYSSIGHMGMMLAGIMSGTCWGMTAGLMMMIAHGLSSSGLFCIANMLYEKTGSRSLFISKGTISLMPTFTLLFFLLTSINMAAPPSINLLSEIGLIISSLFISITFSIPLALMSLMSAIYSLFLYTATQHGKMSSFVNPHSTMKPLSFFIIILHWLPTQTMILMADLI